MITAAKRDGRELPQVVNRHPSGKPDFNRPASRVMGANQTCWQRGRVVGDNEIARAEKRREQGSRQVSYCAIGVNREEFGRLLAKLVVRSHGCPVTAAARVGNAAK